MKTAKTLAGTLLIALSGATYAQDYPNRPIRMVVPFAAGGVVDVTARLLAQKMTERLGWNVIVENKPGGNGFIAVTNVAQAPADGYTLLMAHTGEFSVNPALFKHVPYELERDFKPITLVSDTPLLLVANAATPYRTFDDVIKAAKARPMRSRSRRRAPAATTTWAANGSRWKPVSSSCTSPTRAARRRWRPWPAARCRWAWWPYPLCCRTSRPAAST